MGRKVVLFAALLTAITALAVPGVASATTTTPTGTGLVCDNNTSSNNCLSANGTQGDVVYGKAATVDNEETTSVNAATVCNGTDTVDGGGTTACPFVSGSGMNSTYKGDLIVILSNVPEGAIFEADDSNIVQGHGGDGMEWVLAPNGTGVYILVSVYESNGGTATFACSDGIDEPTLVSTQFLGSGSCDWVLPPI